jgi:DNA repair ATPase RecN
VIGRLDPAEYNPEALRDKLNDLPTLEAVARAHHHVIAAAAQYCATLPMRLATLYHAEDRLAETLHEHRHRLLSTLDQVAGRTEWAVKAYAAPAPAEPADPSAAASGSAYLLRKRAELAHAADARSTAAQAAEQVYARLANLADAARRHRPQPPQLTGRADPMLVNAAFLVSRGATNGFIDAADRLARQQPSMTVEVTGPWPPYSFAPALDIREAAGR